MDCLFVLMRAEDHGAGEGSWCVETMVRGYRHRGDAERLAEKLNVAAEQGDREAVLTVDPGAKRCRLDRLSYDVRHLEVWTELQP